MIAEWTKVNFVYQKWRASFSFCNRARKYGGIGSRKKAKDTQTCFIYCTKYAANAEQGLWKYNNLDYNCISVKSRSSWLLLHLYISYLYLMIHSGFVVLGFILGYWGAKMTIRESICLFFYYYYFTVLWLNVIPVSFFLSTTGNVSELNYKGSQCCEERSCWVRGMQQSSSWALVKAWLLQLQI